MNTCTGCGANIDHKRKGAKWCSEACRVRTTRSPYVPREKHQGNCVVCNKVFTGTARRITCDNCVAPRNNKGSYRKYDRYEYLMNYQANNKRVRIPESTRLRIFQRDGYICHVCGELCDGTLPRDPRMPTIDHLVAWKITQDDSDENLATAHLHCNLSRGMG